MGDHRRAAPGPDLPAAGRGCPLDPSRPRHGSPRSPPTTTTWWCSRTGSPRCAGRATGRRPARPPAAGRAAGDSGLPARPATGRCEVVCFTSDHDASFASLTPRAGPHGPGGVGRPDHGAGRDAGIEQVYCFENRGEEIGVTLSHPHGQIYGYPFVTPRTARMLGQARAYAARHGRRTCSTTWSPGRSPPASGSWPATSTGPRSCRAAARWPYEVLLFPAARVARPPRARASEARAAFCDLYLDVLRRLDALFGVPLPYIAAWHQAPGGDEFAARSSGCTCRCFRSGGRRAS